MKNNTNDEINRLRTYIDKLKNTLTTPSKKHDTPRKIEEFQKFIGREISKAESQIERLRG